MRSSWPGIPAAIAVAMTAAMAMPACSDDGASSPAGPTGSGGSGGDDGGMGGDGGTATCPDGELAGDGSCISPGIPGCAPIFVDADGVCRPASSKCPAATVPVFAEGCGPVGIADCHPDFVGDDGACHPSMDKCPTGTFAVPQLGCVPIDGDAGCGSGTWGAIAAAPGTIWVDPATAPADADGTQAKPFATLDAALALAPSGARIALAAGDYPGTVTLDTDVEIVGRCASMVTLLADDLPGKGAIVQVDAGTVVLRGVGISGGGMGMRVVGGAAVTMSECWMHGVRGLGITAQGDLTLDRSLIEATTALVDGTYGTGLEAYMAAEVTITHSAVVGNRLYGVVSYQDATITASDTLVEGTQPEESSGYYGSNLSVSYGGTMLLEDVASVRGTTAGIEIYPGTVEGKRVLIEGTQLDANGFYGEGILVLDGGIGHLEDSLIVDNIEAGIGASGADAMLELRRTRLQGTLPDLTGADGVGATAFDGALLVLVDSALVDSRGAGVLMQASGALQMEGTLIEDVAAGGANFFDHGYGILVDETASAVVVGSVVRQSTGVGVEVLDGATLELSASLVADTHPLDIGTRGFGIFSSPESTLSLTGSRIEGSSSAAALLFGPATLTDVLLAGTAMADALEAGPEMGDGLVAVGAEITVARVVARDNARSGLLFQDASGSVQGSRSTGNAFGLAVQGLTTPQFASDNAIVGNGVDLTNGAPVLGTPQL